jgi:ubiquinone/menaquinone biosynthesis C-methylase UbiE
VDEEAILGHYGTGYELERLGEGASRIEFARTKELLRRFLPPPPATVLDIGGGPGTYAIWLADLGYRVHLIDAVPLHVEQAAEAAERARHPFTVEVGDARRLEQPDSSVDAVLLLGPLYHLTERTERIQALAEARRVVRTDGTVVAAAISRFASLFDGLASGFLGDPTFDAIVERDVREGQHRNPTDRIEWFTTAYFHHPDELPKEIDVAGLAFVALLGIEGPAQLVRDLCDDPERRDDVLRVARTIEQEPTLLGLSSHLLVVARKRSRPIQVWP